MVGVNIFSQKKEKFWPKPQRILAKEDRPITANHPRTKNAGVIAMLVTKDAGKIMTIPFHDNPSIKQASLHIFSWQICQIQKN